MANPCTWPGRIFGHVQHRAKPPVERIAEPFAELLDVLGRRTGEVLEENLRHLVNRRAIDGQDVFVNAADAKQVTLAWRF